MRCDCRVRLASGHRREQHVSEPARPSPLQAGAGSRSSLEVIPSACLEFSEKQLIL